MARCGAVCELLGRLATIPEAFELLWLSVLQLAASCILLSSHTYVLILLMIPCVQAMAGQTTCVLHGMAWRAVGLCASCWGV